MSGCRLFFSFIFFDWKMRNAPRLAPQLAQNGLFCANYKRNIVASKLTHSPHTLASQNRSWDCSLLRFSLFLSQAWVSLRPWLCLFLSRAWVSLRLWLSLSSVGLSSAVALFLERGSLFGCGSLFRAWVTLRLWLSLSSVGLSSVVALFLERGSLFGCGSLFREWVTLRLWLSLSP